MRVVVSLLALVLLSGCAKSISGTAVDSKPFDPCTDLSDAALRHAGLDPATENSTPFFDEWSMCGWLFVGATDTGVNVYSTERSLSEFRANPQKSDFRDVEAGGRRGMEYREALTRDTACTVGFDTARGSVHVEVAWLRPGARDMCGRAHELARLLLPYLPE